MPRRIPSWTRYLLMALLGVFAVSGLLGTGADFADAATLIQKAQVFGQFAHGFLALAGLGGLLWGRLWASRVLALWVPAAMLAAGLAPVAWGEGTLGSAFSAGLGALLLGLLIWRWARYEVDIAGS